MTTNDVIRAWKDPNYRAGLSEDERAALPASPAGTIEVSETDLAGVEGGGGSNNLYCVPMYRAVNLNASFSCPFMENFRAILTIPAAQTNPAAGAAGAAATLYR